MTEPTSSAAAPAPLTPPEGTPLTLTAPAPPPPVVTTQAPAMAPQVDPALVPELRLVLDHEIMKTSQPTHQLLGRDRGIRHAPCIPHPYSPHRSPAVFTGASHNSIHSSLARRTVTEQPAISSDVM